VSIYLANKQGSFAPHRDYLKLILGGAQYWHLPASYITQLQQIQPAP
jgi:hypothetical protein